MKGYQDLVRDVTVIMRGPPTLTPVQTVQYGDIGHSVSLQCEATALPRLQQLSWSWHGRDLGVGSNDANVSIIESHQGNTVRSTLVISKLEQHHLGDYSCVASNKMGLVKQVVTLRQIGKYTANLIYLLHMVLSLISRLFSYMLRQ